MKKFIFIFVLQLFALGAISQTELMPIVKKIDVKQSKETLLNLDKNQLNGKLCKEFGILLT